MKIKPIYPISLLYLAALLFVLGGCPAPRAAAGHERHWRRGRDWNRAHSAGVSAHVAVGTPSPATLENQ